MMLSNQWYNFLKWLVTIALPGVGALYFALAQIWDLPMADNVNGTINAVVIFLGLLIGYSTRQYNKTVNAPDGDLIVNEVDGETYLGLGINRSVEDLTSKNQVKLNVLDNTGSNTPPE